MSLFVSCYTDHYADEAAGLIRSLQEFGLFHRVEKIESAGNWNINTKLKAPFIRQMLAENPGTPIVWLDADARVRQQPTLFAGLEADMACYFRRGSELLSGTLYFSNSRTSVDIVDQWIEVNSQNPGVFDQRNLQQVVEKNAANPDFTLERLPAAYCLFDLLVKYDRQITAPVIWHRQASRRLRKAVNGAG